MNLRDTRTDYGTADLIASGGRKEKPAKLDFCKVADMKQQMSFAQSEYAGKKKVTRRERFLGEMEQVVPWARLCGVIAPHYPKGERGRPPIGIERMLRIYFLQQWYALADEALEDALYDSQAMRSFAGIDLSVEAVPDATTLLKFRHLLEAHDSDAADFCGSGRAFERAQATHERRHDRGCYHHCGTFLD